MEEKDIEKLIELVIAGGELRGDAFHFSEQEKREFAERNGMSGLFETYARVENDLSWAAFPEDVKKYGERFVVRVDASSGNGIRRYYMENKVSRDFTAVPGRKSSDAEKLLYISQKGVGGIDSIFGHNVLDRGRDRFLASHGLQGLYAKSRDAGRNGGDNDLQARTDRKVRDVASLEYDKVTLRKKGLKI